MKTVSQPDPSPNTRSRKNEDPGAVLRQGGEPWELTELDLDEPKAGEVLIRYEAAGRDRDPGRTAHRRPARGPLIIDMERIVALRSTLAADGYLLQIAEQSTRVRVTISAT